MDLGQFQAKLIEFDALRDEDEIRRGVVDRIEPQYASEWPAELDSSVRDALINAGIRTPYQHQVEAIRKSLQGYDVVLESPTASGKTLAFTAPMLHSLVRNEGSHALMIYPMKALAFDQREQIRRLCEPLGIESWPYDGDTPDEHKSAMRVAPPHILLTNPEMLNASFLGKRDSWNSNFLENIKYLVIDEVHEYRGYFGVNMALTLRRFFLYLNRIGANPRVFLSTATCANPKEHARNLTEREVEVISAGRALRPLRNFLFVKPERIQSSTSKSKKETFQYRVEQAVLTALSEHMRTLVFGLSKRFLEDVFRNCRRKADKLGLDPKRMDIYYADLHIETRHKTQRKIKSGEIDVVFTTNALELGLDIGLLDGVISGRIPTQYNVRVAANRARRAWLE